MYISVFCVLDLFMKRVIEVVGGGGVRNLYYNIYCIDCIVLFDCDYKRYKLDRLVDLVWRG